MRTQDPLIDLPLLLVGLVGKAGAGKDTAAEHLAIAHQFEPYALATPIKTMALALLTEVGLPDAPQYLTHRELKEAPIAALGNISPRRIIQTLGTEWGRHQGADFWLRCADLALGLPLAPVHHRIVISDVRFANEAAWVRAHGGVLIRIDRDPAQLPSVCTHISETEQASIECDHIVFNYGSLAELYDGLDVVMLDVLRVNAEGVVA